MRKHFKYLLIGIMTLFVGFLTLNKQVVKANGNETIEFTFVAYENDEPAFLDATGIPAAQTHPKGVKIYHIDVPNSDHYSFAGWVYEKNSEMVKLAVGQVFTENTTFYATWKKTPHFITYELSGGTNSLDNPRIFYVTDEIILQDPYRDGYSFDGWYLDSDHTLPITKIEEGSQSLKVYAKFVGQKHQVIFKDHDGSILKIHDNIENGTAALAPADPTRVGYVFDGWDKDFDNVTENLIVTAKYVVKLSTVTFIDAQGEREVENVPYGGFVAPLVAREKVGHTFVGWDLSTDNVFDDMTVTAIYEINQYTITFDTNGGSAIAPIKQNYNSEIIAPANPTREGYSFAGWDVAVPNNMPAGDLTITASWTINQYQVNFIVEDVTVDTLTLNFGATINKPADPVVAGKDFSGWFLDGNLFDFDTGTVLARNMDLIAGFDVTTYDVVFKDYDGSTIVIRNVSHGSDALAPADPERTGYSFDGWDGIFTNVQSALEITATYKINQYTITFDTDGGTIIAPITQDYNTGVTPPNDPTKTGYDFDGWDVAIPANMPAENITITATWVIKQYTITFNSNGGTTVQAAVYDYNALTTVPSSPTKTGYSFDGWYSDVALSVEHVFANMPAENFTVYAKWELETYNVNYVLYAYIPNDPVVFDPTLKQYNVEMVNLELEIPNNRTSSLFAGWYDNDEFDGNAITTLEELSGNLVLYAKWELRTYTITFDSKGGSHVADMVDNVQHGQTVELQTPFREGFEFQGWFYEDNGIIKELTDQIPIINNYDVFAEWIMDDTSFVVAATFVVELPYNTPSDANVYLESNLEGWQVKHLMNVSEGVASITLNITIPYEGFDYMYKFSRGDWSNAEVIGMGEYEGFGSAHDDNRHYMFNDNTETTITQDELVISSWADHEELDVLYYITTVTFDVTIPENTPIEDDIFIIGNFNNWTLSNDYKLVRNGNEATGEFDIKYLNIDNEDLTYKFVHGSLGTTIFEEIEFGQYSGLSLEDDTNRHYIFNEYKETLNLNVIVVKWLDIDEFYVDFIVNVESSNDIYLAGNFNGFNNELPDWRPPNAEGNNDAIKLVRVDGYKQSITLRLKVKSGDTILYKLIMDDGTNYVWEEFGHEVNREYGAWLNPVYEVTLEWQVK